MSILNLIKTAFVEIRNNKMRSFLTFFSISIGVISIMYTLTLIYSMNYRTRKAIEISGPGRLNVELKNRWRAQQEGEEVVNDFLTLDDAKSVRRNFPELYMVAPIITKWVRLSDEMFEQFVWVMGVDLEWVKRGWIYKMKGRFINQYDIDNYARVCVLIEKGGWIKKPRWLKFWKWKDRFQEYVKHNDMLGKTIALGNSLYKVVGVLKEPPAEKNPKTFIGFGGWEPNIIVPITTAQRFLSGWSNSAGIEKIYIDTGSPRTIEKYKRMVKQTIKSRHGTKLLFDVKDYREVIKSQLADKQRDMITVLIIGIIAILAGGIGIMNVSLATIYSRIKEIGVRRAVGARQIDIMAQFMVEAMMLGFMGGIAGVIIGFLGIKYLALKGNMDMLMLRWWMSVIAVLAATLTGFAASLYPAKVAARLDPIEALRYE